MPSKAQNPHWFLWKHWCLWLQTIIFSFLKWSKSFSRHFYSFERLLKYWYCDRRYIFSYFMCFSFPHGRGTDIWNYFCWIPQKKGVSDKGIIEVKGDVCGAPGERRRVMELSELMGKRDLWDTMLLVYVMYWITQLGFFKRYTFSISVKCSIA